MAKASHPRVSGAAIAMCEMERVCECRRYGGVNRRTCEARYQQAIRAVIGAALVPAEELGLFERTMAGLQGALEHAKANAPTLEEVI